MSDLLRSFRDDFAAQIAATPEQPMIIDSVSGHEWSWADCGDLVHRIGKKLQADAVPAGSTIISMLPNSLEKFLIFLACLKFGYRFAPLPPSSPEREIRRLFDTVRPKVMVAQPELNLEPFSSTSDDIRIWQFSTSQKFDWLSEIDEEASIASSAQSIIYLQTSGSTGEPKVMVIDGDKLWSSGKAFVSLHSFVAEDSRFYNVMPMSYLGGLFNLGLIPMATGGSFVIAEPLSGASLLRFWHDVERFDINTLWLVPTSVRALLTLAGRANRSPKKIEPAKHVRAAFLGTAPIDLKTKESFESEFGIPLLENFALSETTFFTTETLENKAGRTEGSVGAPTPYISLRLSEYIADEEGRRTEMIEVKSPFLFLGYLEPSGNVDKPFSDDGYMATGDLGHLSNTGHLVIDGRTRDVIKKGGIMVVLPEMENIARSAPGVAEAVAVPVPHDFYGEDYVLFVVFEESDADDEDQRLSNVRNWVLENTVRSKWPHRVHLLKDVPRTRSGKVAKAELAELAKKIAEGGAN